MRNLRRQEQHITLLHWNRLIYQSILTLMSYIFYLFLICVELHLENLLAFENEKQFVHVIVRMRIKNCVLSKCSYTHLRHIWNLVPTNIYLL